MKVVSSFLVLLVLFACGGNKTDVASVKEIVSVNYMVDGMICSLGCAKTIQKEVAAIKGVSSCDVSFEDKKAHIEFDKSQLSEKEIIAVIEGVADGQYKVNEWVEEEKDDVEKEDVVASEENIEQDV